MPPIPPKKYERRLDALAELLQGRSACVAVANIGGRFLITANERFNNSEHLSIVKQIMTYFKTIAMNGKIAVDHNIRDLILSKIYNLKMDTTALGNGVLKISKPALFSNFINSSKIAARHWPTESECDGATENNLFVKACIAYALIRDLYISLVKIENGLVKALDNEKFHINDQEEVAVTQRELQAFRNFTDQDISITANFRANRDNLVHAEMQILGFLLRSQPKTPIYIGVSKRCCWNCHCMITAANEVLEQNNISFRINVRDDAHDGISDPWNKPKIFTLIDVKSGLLKHIIKKIDAKYNELKQIIPQSRDYVQSHSRSSSEASLDYIGKKATYLRAQETRQLVLSDLFDISDSSERNFTMKQNLDILNFSIELCNGKHLEELFKISEQDTKDSIITTISTFFSEMLNYCSKKKMDINIIRSFINMPQCNNKHFPDVACREFVLVYLNTLFEKHHQTLELEVEQDNSSRQQVLTTTQIEKKEPKPKLSARKI